MPRYEIDAHARSSAPPSAVFALLADGATWPRWGAWTAFALESPGADAPEGPGAVRAFTSRTLGRTVVSRERVLAVVPDARLEYALLSGLPLEGYRGRIELRPDGDGTEIRWTAGFDGAPPAGGRIYRRLLERFIRDAATRVARHAEEAAA